MRARLTIEYDRNLKGEQSVSVFAETEPERVELTEIDLLGILEAAKYYVMRPED